jgi:hypothetical protein
MMNRPVTTLVITALLSTSATMPVAAQVRPAPDDGAQTLPVRPVPPAVRPTPLPEPVPGGPQIQPPRPGGSQIQPPRPGRPEIQPPRPTYPGRPEIQPPVRPGNGYGETLRCESYNGRRQRCAANTGNRVQLVTRLGGSCNQGRSWGYDSRSIWVDRGCRAIFTYGRQAGGGYYPPDRDRGPSTGAIIAGVAVAGGLVALLASAANKRKNEAAASAADGPATFPARGPATLVADLSPLPSAARPSVQLCLNDAARQIGATGGTRLSYDRLVSIEPGNGGWRFGASLTATYPDGPRVLPLYCRATPSKVIQLDFANNG